MRCDVNVSLRPTGTQPFGVKIEVKNLNSARSVQRALEYEIERQAKALDAGERMVQETRGWDDDRGITVSQRIKEDAHDYRYFPEPDLPPVFVSHAWITELRGRLPELPDARRTRYMSELGLSHYDAVQLTSTREITAYFERVIELYPKPKVVANWVQGEVFRLLRLRLSPGLPLNEELADPEQVVPAAHLAELLALVENGTVNQATAKQVFEDIAGTGVAPGQIVADRGLAQISDTSEVEQLVTHALAENAQAVADFRAGKAAAMGFLTGQVMKATRGKANPAVVNVILQRQLNSS